MMRVRSLHAGAAGSEHRIAMRRTARPSASRSGSRPGAQVACLDIGSQHSVTLRRTTDGLESSECTSKKSHSSTHEMPASYGETSEFVDLRSEAVRPQTAPELPVASAPFRSSGVFFLRAESRHACLHRNFAAVCDSHGSRRRTLVTVPKLARLRFAPCFGCKFANGGQLF